MQAQSMPERGLYKHYKGGIYRVLGYVQHSETEEWMVHYAGGKPVREWVRPVSNWNCPVDLKDYQGPRFTPATPDDLYTTPLPDYGDLMSINDFLAAVADKSFVDYDGYGHPVRNNLMNRYFEVRPSGAKEIPSEATHIVWFNR